MVNKSFLKECFRAIRGSFSRFLAIFLIVALGAGFLAALLATTPDMRHTVSLQLQETNLFDLRIAGTLGLEEGDAAAIAGVEGISSVMAAHTLDREVALTSGDTVVGRFHGVTAWEGDDPALMNRQILVEGRWPAARDECVVMQENDMNQQSLSIGQTISLLPPEPDEDGEIPDDPFTIQTFRIVGVVHSGYYLSTVQRGSTTIGNGRLGAIVFIDDSLLDLDYYTDIFATVEGALSAEAFSDAYERLVTPVQERVETLSDTQKHLRADRLIGDAREELEEARQELADKTAEGQQELDDALLELQDGEAEYADGLQELEEGKQELIDAFADLQQGEADLLEGHQELLDGEAEYADGLKELEDGQKEIDEAQAELDDAFPQLQDAKKELQDALRQLQSGQADLDKGMAQLNAAQADVDKGQAQLDAARAQLEARQAELEAAYQAGYIDEATYQAGMAEIRTGLAYLEQQQAQLDAAQREIDVNRRQLQAGQRELDRGWEEYEAGRKEVEEADVEYHWGLQQLAHARKELEEGRQELLEGRADLDEGWADYHEGQQELADGWKEYYDGEQELADAQQELADGRRELDDGWQDYEEGKQEFADKIADANLKIRDAQDQIDEIEDPEWHVLTRGEGNEGYIFYESDTEKVSAIAKVFPIFFCLVAALVASTTMTRMIDEDRGTIGTLKALGYSNAAIAGKYLLYATLACVLGAAVGLAFFLPVFPRIIANAYTMMYLIPPIQAADHLPYILISAGSILLAVVLSTLGALKGSLQDTAAVLMRPKAPPAGKRILLERVKPLWSRMQFSHKVTARNLFRYKKRLIMTVIGIAGCTALLVAGFGLRDSIGDIAGIQFTQLQTYDMTLKLKHAGDQTADRHIAAILRDESRVLGHLPVHLETGKGIGADGYTTDLSILVPSDADLFPHYHVLRQRVGHQPVAFSGQGAVLTEKAAKMLDIRPGDTLTLRNQDDVEATIPILGICENYVQGYVFLPESLYGQAFDQACAFDTLLVKTPQMDADQRDALAAQLLKTDHVTGVSFSATTIETFDDMLGSIDYIVILLIVAAAALAFVVLYNLTNINICERQKEIATLKVLGFYRGEVSGYVFRETAILSLMGTLLGLAVGAGFHRFVVQTAETDAAMFGRMVYFPSYCYAAALSLVFTGLVSLALQKKLHHIDMVESLKAPE